MILKRSFSFIALTIFVFNFDHFRLVFSQTFSASFGQFGKFELRTSNLFLKLSTNELEMFKMLKVYGDSREPSENLREHFLFCQSSSRMRRVARIFHGKTDV